MQATPQNLVLAAIGDVLRRAGFEREGRTWWRSGVETIQVVDVAATASARQMFLGAGVYLRKLGPSRTPAPHECHIRVSAEEIASRPLVFQRAMDFGDPDRDVERRVRAVIPVLERRVLPWLEGHSTEARARSALRRGAVAAWPTPAALRWLGLDDSAQEASA